MLQLAFVGVLLLDFINTEPSWHRNLRRSRQRARGLLAAHRLGFLVSPATLQSAAAKLQHHHGSSVGTFEPLPMGEGKKPDWYCGRCKGKDGGKFLNFHFRTSCKMCQVAKGKCHGGDKQRNGAPTMSLAERQVAAAKTKAKQDSKQGNKAREQQLQMQNDMLKRERGSEAQAGGGCCKGAGDWQSLRQ